MTWLRIWRKWASLTYSKRVETSLEWLLKRFWWTGWVRTLKSVVILLRNNQTHTEAKHQNKINVTYTLSTTINSYKLSQNNRSLLISLHSWSTREPSLWMKRGQRLLLWPRWASCPSPLRSASLWTTPFSSWSTSTAQTALCSWVVWLIPHRAKHDQLFPSNSLFG